MTIQIYSHPECNRFCREVRAGGFEPVPHRTVGWMGPAVLDCTKAEILGTTLCALEEFDCAEGRAVRPVHIGRLVPARICDSLAAALDEMYEAGRVILPSRVDQIGRLTVMQTLEYGRNFTLDLTRTHDAVGWATQMNGGLISEPTARRMERRARSPWRGAAARTAQECLETMLDDLG